MSWAEDNNIDVYDPILYIDPYLDWEQGFHTTKDGEQIKLRDMTTEHLKNTIRYFKRTQDTTPLEKELEKRNK